MYYDRNDLVNVLEEAENALSQFGKTPKDVLHVGVPGSFKCSWETFAEFAEQVDRDNSGYDEIDRNLIMTGDGWWMERDMDSGTFGDSWWSFRQQPSLNNETLYIDSVELSDLVLTKRFSGEVCGERFDFGEHWRNDLDQFIAGEFSLGRWHHSPEKYGLIRTHFYGRDNSDIYNRGEK